MGCYWRGESSGLEVAICYLREPPLAMSLDWRFVQEDEDVHPLDMQFLLVPVLLRRYWGGGHGAQQARAGRAGHTRRWRVL